ncbi:tetratricopeptide repeat protein [Ferruginibacter sp. SUN002]|uniref:tetratricopeptide repeat protein n=1 Tax=Ferruginibacter sp. SUN002 TaxID=2937789 RepID=UPI003D35E329
MKKIVNILFLGLLIMACNNSNSNSAAVALPEVEKNLKADIEKYPDSAKLKDSLINYYTINGNYSQAIAEIDKFIKKDTANAVWWDTKAQLYFQNNDTINSIKALEKAVEINADPEYIISLGAAYAQARDPKALTMSDALLLTPTARAQTYAIFIKGLYYNSVSDYAKAIPYFDECIRSNYIFMDAYTEKVIALLGMGKYNDALGVAKKTVTISNTYPDGYYWMGRCYEKLNDKNEAIRNYQAAIELAAQVNDDYILARDALGKLGVK